MRWNETTKLVYRSKNNSVTILPDGDFFGEREYLNISLASYRRIEKLTYKKNYVTQIAATDLPYISVYIRRID